MKIRKIRIENWGPHTFWEADIPDDAKTIALCAENDEGKSWIVRAIGFLMSIGRNSYGDQTSILAGESEARLSLAVEHEGEIHTIEKIVRGKGSETEGTETYINGAKVGTAEMTEFYNKLGLPTPDIWLPITIAMQNQTDSHLRSKKSDREEALRAMVRLERTDAWKEALREKTNAFDKGIIEESSSLKGELEGLKKQEKEILEEIAGLQEQSKSLNEPFGPEGPKVQNNTDKAKTWEEKNKARKQLALLLVSREREKTLAEAQEQRIKLSLTKLGTPPDEETIEKKIESLEKEKFTRRKEKVQSEIKEITRELQAKKSELPAEKGISPDALEQQLEKLTQLEAKELENQTLSQKVASETKQLEEPLTAVGLDKSDDIASVKAEVETLLGKAKAEGEKEAKRKETIKIGQEAGISLNLGNEGEKALELARKEIETAGSHEIRLEGKRLLLRVLTEEDTDDECPCCKAPLDREKLGKDKESIKEEVAGILDKQNRIKTLHREWKTLEAWAAAEQDKPKKQKFSSEELETLAKTITNLQESQRRLNLSTQEIKRWRETLPEEMRATPTAELRTKIQEHWKKASKEEVLKETIKGLKARLEEKGEQLDEWAKEIERREAAEDTEKSLTDEELETKLSSTKESLGEARKLKRERKALEEELKEAQARSNATKIAKKEIVDQKLALEVELEEGCKMEAPEPHPQNLEEWEAIKDTYIQHSENLEKLKPILENLPKKVVSITQNRNAVLTRLEEVEKQAKKAASARKLISFLDYKNAPRRLLEKITSLLFDRTNRLAVELEAEIQLKLGNNLEFLTYQQRGGRWIEQKTERLGFGKGAILGICFRLASLQVLLKKTGFLILDEPSANVDSKRKGALKSFLQRLAHEKESGVEQIILIEHDEDVVSLCDKRIQVGTSRA